MAFGGRFLGTIVLVGVGAVAVAAIIASPKLLRAARPSAREALRWGWGLYERARGAAAEFGEDIEDLVAEVAGELRARQAPAPPDQASKEAKQA